MTDFFWSQLVWFPESIVTVTEIYTACTSEPYVWKKEITFGF